MPTSMSTLGPNMGTALCMAPSPASLGIQPQPAWVWEPPPAEGGMSAFMDSPSLGPRTGRQMCRDPYAALSRVEGLLAGPGNLWPCAGLDVPRRLGFQALACPVLAWLDSRSALLPRHSFESAELGQKAPGQLETRPPWAGGLLIGCMSAGLFHCADLGRKAPAPGQQGVWGSHFPALSQAVAMQV